MKCEICLTENYQHKHRIISGAYGGKYTKNNVAKLCATCHTKVHEGLLVIEGIFLTTIGYRLLWHKVDEMSITNMEQQDKVYLSKRQR